MASTNQTRAIKSPSGPPASGHVLPRHGKRLDPCLLHSSRASSWRGEKGSIGAPAAATVKGFASAHAHHAQRAGHALACARCCSDRLAPAAGRPHTDRGSSGAEIGAEPAQQDHGAIGHGPPSILKSSSRAPGTPRPWSLHHPLSLSGVYHTPGKGRRL